MVPVKGNYSHFNACVKCFFCNISHDTQHHLFECLFFDKKIQMSKFFNEELDMVDVNEIIRRLHMLST